MALLGNIRPVLTSDTEKSDTGRSGPSGKTAADTREMDYALLWQRYERLPSRQQHVASQRLEVITHVEALLQGGRFESQRDCQGQRKSRRVTKDGVVRCVALMTGLPRSSFYVWLKRIAGVPREHWLPCLVDRRADAYSDKYSGAYSGIRGAGKQLDTGPCLQQQNDEKSGDRDTLVEPSPENHGAVDTLAVSASPCMDRHRSNKQAGDTHSDKQPGLTGASSRSASLGTGAEDH